MKRTRNINRTAFRKNWRACRLSPLTLAVTAILMLAGCEQSDETVALYQNAGDCSNANPGQSAQCNAAWNKAQQEAEKTAPKYASRSDCVAEFGEDQCQQVPAQSGMQAEAAQSGSLWMPLMAGYMLGRLTSGGAGFASQPLFTSRNPASPLNGKFVDATGTSYGNATSGRTVTVPKSALAAKPVTTRTITRGGFGDTAARKATMQRNLPGHASRSFGG